jgi:hypothetical protein
MNLLEDRLNSAAEEARQHVAGVGSRPATSIQNRQRHRRALIGTVAVATMFGIFGATALVTSSDPGLDAGSEATVSPTTEGPVAVSEVDAAPATAVPAASDITHLVGRISASSELSAEFGADRLIDGDLERGWQDASLRGVGAQIVLEFTEPVAITEVIVHPYSDEEQFFRNWWIRGYEVRTNDLSVPVAGRMVRDPYPQVVELNTTETFQLTFSVNTTFPALSDSDNPPYSDGGKPPFDELAIAEIQVFGTPVGDTGTSTATTTTTIVAPQLPPALRGTPLTTAWGEYVVETMAMADYEMAEDEIADMDVFEKEMDRGLVHATFTVDGNEWAIAFGPWRDGEYSEDPAVLQEQFSTEKPGQKTAEGLLLISERSDPSYVYLAMDVGKIAISFQPAIIGSAAPLEDLEALALDLAPIVRKLLEADLIEWNT